MGELIPIKNQDIDGNVVRTVNARELHEYLEVGRDFNTWIKQRIEKYRFIENQDYVVFTKTGENPAGGRPAVEFHLTIDMAKELCMVENNEQGRKARRYFIECEKVALQATKQIQVPQTFSEALRLAAELEEERVELRKKIERDQHKVEFHDLVKESTGVMEIGQFAKTIGTGPKKLFAWLRENSFLMSSPSRHRHNLPYQRYLDAGLFEVIENIITIPHSDGSKEDVVTTKTMITPKGQIAVTKKWQEAPIRRANS